MRKAHPTYDDLPALQKTKLLAAARAVVDQEVKDEIATAKTKWIEENNGVDPDVKGNDIGTTAQSKSEWDVNPLAMSIHGSWWAKSSGVANFVAAESSIKSKGTQGVHDNDGEGETDEIVKSWKQDGWDNSWALKAAAISSQRKRKILAKWDIKNAETFGLPVPEEARAIMAEADIGISDDEEAGSEGSEGYVTISGSEAEIDEEEGGEASEDEHDSGSDSSEVYADNSDIIITKVREALVVIDNLTSS